MSSLYTFETLVMMGLYAALLIGVGIYLSRTESQGDFIIGNRKIGVIPTAASLAASFRDGAGIAFWISMGLAAAYGMATWFILGIALGAVAVMFFGPRLRERGATLDQLTINEMVGTSVGPWAAKATALVMLVFTFCLTALNFSVSGSIFAAILHQPQWLGVLVVGVLLVSYIILGGYKSVIVTDTIQLFFIFSLFCVPFVLPVAPEDMKNFGSIAELPLADKIGITVFAWFFILSMPEAWQRCLSAKNKQTIRRALPLMTAMLAVMTLSLIWLGMGLRALPAETVSKYPQAYLAVFDPALGVSPWFIGYLVMVFIAITMSTQSSACYSFTSTFTQIFLSHKKSKNADHAQYVRRTKIQTFIFLTVSALASLSISNLIQMIFDIIGFFICLAPIYLLSIADPAWLQKHKNRDALFTALTLVGIAIFLVLFFNGQTQAGLIYAVLPAILTAAMVGGVAVWYGAALTGKAKRRKLDRTKNSF